MIEVLFLKTSLTIDLNTKKTWHFFNFISL